jgi:hypothetical protein
MKNTEKEILIKAKKILVDLNPQFFKDENLKKVVYHEKDVVARPKGEIIDTWIAVVDEPIFDTSIFLTISDETGEPLYIQNKHIIREIEKDSNGKYVTKK